MAVNVKIVHHKTCPDKRGVLNRNSEVLSIFRTNQILTGVLLIFYILILRASVLVVPPETVSGGRGILSEQIFEWISPESLWAHLAATVLLLIQGFLINSIVANHRLSNEVNLFPGVFYVLVCSLFPDFLNLSPPLIANTFLLIALSELFETYKVPKCADKIFNVGFWIGAASLFYFSYIIYLLWALIGLGILRAFYIRERLGLIIGALVPYILLGVYFFWYDKLDSFIDTQITGNKAWLDIQSLINADINLIKIVLFSLILVIILLTGAQYKSKKIIQVQKKIDILLIAVPVGLLSFLFQSEITFEHLLIVSLPVGILISFNFSDMKRKWAESIHFIIITAILAYQFRSLLT